MLHQGAPRWGDGCIFAKYKPHAITLSPAHEHSITISLILGRPREQDSKGIGSPCSRKEKDTKPTAGLLAAHQESSEPCGENPVPSSPFKSAWPVMNTQ